jgi:hypothetical protein
VSEGQPRLRDYAARRQMGLCSKCPSMAIPGKSRCRPCLDQQRDIQKARLGRCAVEGLCISCAKQPPTISIFCAPCYQSYRASIARHQAKPEAKQRDRDYYRHRRQERLEQGRCLKCGLTPPSDDSLWCGLCLRENRNKGTDRRRHWREQGQCTRCGGSRDRADIAYCSPCLTSALARMKARRDRRIADGLCTDCGQRAEEGIRRCRPCADQANAYANDYNRQKRNQDTTTEGAA